MAVIVVVAVGQNHASPYTLDLSPSVAYCAPLDRGVQERAPVDQAASAEDDSLLVHAHEGLVDGDGEVCVHGEDLPGPVHRRAKAAELLGDRDQHYA